ncbi:hypothetical protein ABG768_007996 [Culter alburnus]|uniref:G-protein coupled receptors family 1 profile domain-containing protein n=1 Tax=Culter alburnus TaxID=194366 RepID=A0AAW1ZQJ4_CULAL
MDYINKTQTEQKNGTNVSSVFTHQVLPVLYFSSALVVYLKNMVVADILMLFTYPWHVVGDLGYGGLQLKLIVCRYTAVLFYLSMYTGITFMSLISLERYFKVHWHEISAHFNVGIFWVAFILMVFCYTSAAG